MKTRRFCFWLTVGLSLVWLGCTHDVAFKKPDTFAYTEKVPLDVVFFMKKELREKTFEGRAWSSGIANKWVVPVGDAAHEYAVAYLSEAFQSFREVDSDSSIPQGNFLIRIDDIRYWMEGQAAHSAMWASVTSSAKAEVLKKEYSADGPSGYGRVLAAGAFAQKSAIRQSTHVVFENIFKRLVDDIRDGYPRWRQ
jgi:hypothetical protein